MISKYPEVPWKQISAFRNILVHDYLGEIDPETIYKIIESHLAILESSVQKMLNIDSN